MITIDSTEAERYKELKNAELVVVPWIQDNGGVIPISGETISHAIQRFADESGIIGKRIQMYGISEKILITKRTVGESIAAMRRQQADLLDLGKMFTVLEAVLNNAVLLEVERFRYEKLHKAKLIVGEYQYISAFHDSKVLYPVKVTVERDRREDYTNIHVIITVGKVGLADVSEKIKRSVAYTGVHSSDTDDESLFSEDASFVISIQQLIELFNFSEGIILKNLPDKMLSDNQKKIKCKIREKDVEKAKTRG